MEKIKMRFPQITTREQLDAAIRSAMTENGYTIEQAEKLFAHIAKECEGSVINTIEKNIALLEYLIAKNGADFKYVYDQFTGNCFEVFNADAFRDYLYEYDIFDCADYDDYKETVYLRELTDNYDLATETAYILKYEYQEIDGIYYIYHM